jgi:hypothetical protein
MMYQYTPEQHAQIVDALASYSSYKIQDTAKALAMLKAMQPVHPIDTSQERVEKLEENVQMLLEALKECKLNAGHPEIVWDISKKAIKQAEGATP